MYTIQSPETIGMAMNSIFKIVITLLFIAIFIPASYAEENLFYVLRSHAPGQIPTAENTLASLKKHYNLIGTLISQAYQVDQNGMVWGYVDPDIASFAKNHNVKLMVMVTNSDFNKEKTHQFLTNPKAQERAIKSIINACQTNHFRGVQFDFEMIPLDDKEALTHFLQTAAHELHQQGFLVSFAVAPLVSDNPQPSEFLKRSYTIWEGAYDLKALGECGDFVSIMTYDQHTSGTTPGPTASYPWVLQAIKYALRFVPAQKISLGIASYSSYWYTGTSSSSNRLTMHMTEIDYDKVQYLLQKYRANLRWDDVDKVNYAFYQHNWLEEYIFAEDAKSFQTKIDLVKKYNLHGISVFRLGIEDPKIWKVLTDSA